MVIFPYFSSKSGFFYMSSSQFFGGFIYFRERESGGRGRSRGRETGRPHTERGAWHTGLDPTALSS